jgi:adenylate kinase
MKKQERKEDLNKKKLEQLKEKEKQIIEKKSEVIKQYLHENLVPILAKGIKEICEQTPEDPIDYLACYLFSNSSKVNFTPDKYKEN